MIYYFVTFKYQYQQREDRIAYFQENEHEMPWTISHYQFNIIDNKYRYWNKDWYADNRWGNYF